MCAGLSFLSPPAHPPSRTCNVSRTVTIQSPGITSSTSSPSGRPYKCSVRPLSRPLPFSAHLPPRPSRRDALYVPSRLAVLTALSHSQSIQVSSPCSTPGSHLAALPPSVYPLMQIPKIASFQRHRPINPPSLSWQAPSPSFRPRSFPAGVSSSYGFQPSATSPVPRSVPFLFSSFVIHYVAFGTVRQN